MMFLGLVVLGAGIGLILYANKDAFDRRNEAGVEVYKSYIDMLMKRFFATFLRLVGFVLFLKGGMIMFGSAIGVA